MRFSFVLYSLLVLIQIVFPSIIYSQDTIPSQIIEEVVFVANKIYEPTSLKITNRDFKRLAASFDDPSRILMHYPGFSNANDQANGIIYHGLPSHFSGWQLNGLEIVNPNHLSNAGTFSDVSSLSAGGVNIFSGNLINRYDYNTSLNKDMKGTALAGISNIIIDSLDRSYAQLSLLGLEAGFRNKNKNHIVYGNYRYSFTGLLGEIGVSFGNEKIAFNDLLVGYTFNGKNNKFSLLYSTGRSSNIHKRSLDNITVLKDYFNIDYSSTINIFQLRYNLKIKSDSRLNFGFSYSDYKDRRDALGYIKTMQTDSFEVVSNDRNYIYKLVFHQELKLKNWFVFGVKEINNVFDFEPYHISAVYKFRNGNRWSINPYLQKQISYSNFNIDMNLSALYDNGFYYTPNMKVSYQLNNHSINFIGGMSAQILNPYNENEDYTTGINYDINYQYSKNKFTTNIGVFLHDLNHIPSDNNYYSAINSFNILNLDNIFPNTSAITKGVYAHISKELNNGLWLNLNSTIFDLKYKSSNYDWQNAETNYGKIYNFNIGKKIKLRKGSMFISSSFHYRGGAFQYPPIFFNFTPTVDYSQPPLIRLGNYKRLDLRINYTKGKVFWSLDIQNALNTLNGAYQYFDIGGLRTQKQLGMIPVLTYKYSF